MAIFAGRCWTVDHFWQVCNYNGAPRAPRRRLGAEPSRRGRRELVDGSSVFQPDVARQRKPGDLAADSQRLAFVTRRVTHRRVQLYVTCNGTS